MQTRISITPLTFIHFQDNSPWAIFMRAGKTA